MRGIVDTSVPNAWTYYSTYLGEPSPAGDITLSAGTLAAVKHLDLNILLSAMKDIGSAGELLVVTHASTEGFLMALWPGSTSTLKFSVMDKILESAEGVRRREAIRSLPAKGVPEAWRKWYRDFDPGIKLEPGYETNPDWQNYVETQYNRWFDERGRVVHKLAGGGKDLKELLELLKEVRKLAFKRIEFRACQIGADTDAMKKVAEFLQVKTVVGPKEVETFYGSFPKSLINFVADPAKLAAALKKQGGRKFGDTLGILMLPHGARITAKDAQTLKEFVKKSVSSKFAGTIPPLVIGGLNSVGAGAVNFFLPLEREYKNQFAVFSRP
jgi:hypothetical protein